MSTEKPPSEAVEPENRETSSPTSTAAIQPHSKTPTATEEVKSAKDASAAAPSSTEEDSSIVNSPVQLALISLAMGLAIFVTGLVLRPLHPSPFNSPSKFCRGGSSIMSSFQGSLSLTRDFNRILRLFLQQYR
ncbi:hypothetical protein EIK77_002314 [Talaromyces pinophilus]|nr:hypothetical protein EIK77_002314 [Talaromyces pinophilus]